MHLGTYAINDYLVFTANTHNNKGLAADASAITYRIYAEDSETPLKTGSMSKFDDANTLGFYLTRIQLLLADGFAHNKSYAVYISATVAGQTGTASHFFKMAPTPITVSDILAGVIEGTLTLKQVLRLVLSLAAGKASGGGTTTVTFRDTGDTKDRITMTVDTETGDRSAVVRDVTD